MSGVCFMSLDYAGWRVSARNRFLSIIKGLLVRSRCGLMYSWKECGLVEAKAVDKTLPIHKAQLLSYMKLLDVPLGLLINFHEMKVTDGISRLILPGAHSPKP